MGLWIECERFKAEKAIISSILGLISSTSSADCCRWEFLGHCWSTAIKLYCPDLWSLALRCAFDFFSSQRTTKAEWTIKQLTFRENSMVRIRMLGLVGRWAKWAEQTSKSNGNAKPSSQWVSHWQLIILFCHPHIGMPSNICFGPA